LNEESWDDVVCNYPESSFAATLKDFYLEFKKVC